MHRDPRNAPVRSSVFDKGFEGFISKYNTPGFDFDVNCVRIFVCAFFIWKLLSRDFSFYATVPEGIFHFYPFKIYPSSSYILTMGLPIISEIATFHWIHWFVPRPSEFGYQLIQGCAVVLLLVTMVWGRGPRRIFSIGCYILLIYLWGHLFLAGQEIDAVLLYFGLLACFTMGDYVDRPIWDLRTLYGKEPTVAAGRTVSTLFLVFVFFYFASGLNKLTDLSPAGWFSYDLIESLEQFRIRSDVGVILVPKVFEFLYPYRFLDYVLPPIVYMSHVIVPYVFFRRDAVFKFFLFYAGFHFMAFGVGISFTGYIFVWFCLFPYHKIVESLARRWSEGAGRSRSEAQP